MDLVDAVLFLDPDVDSFVPFGQGTILHLYPLSLIGNGEFHAVVAPLPLEIHRNAIVVDIRGDKSGADMPLAYFFQPDALPDARTRHVPAAARLPFPKLLAAGLRAGVA